MNIAMAIAWQYSLRYTESWLTGNSTGNKMRPEPLIKRDLQEVKPMELVPVFELERFRGLKDSIFQSAYRCRIGFDDAGFAKAMRLSKSHVSRIKSTHHFPTDLIADAIQLTHSLGPLQKLFIDVGAPPEFVEWAANYCGTVVKPSKQELIGRVEAYLAELKGGAIGR